MIYLISPGCLQAYLHQFINATLRSSWLQGIALHAAVTWAKPPRLWGAGAMSQMDLFMMTRGREGWRVL